MKKVGKVTGGHGNRLPWPPTDLAGGFKDAHPGLLGANELEGRPVNLQPMAKDRTEGQHVRVALRPGNPAVAAEDVQESFTHRQQATVWRCQPQRSQVVLSSLFRHSLSRLPLPSPAPLFGDNVIREYFGVIGADADRPCAGFEDGNLVPVRPGWDGQG